MNDNPDDKVLELSLDETKFNAGVERSKGPGRRRLMYRVRPLLILHCTVAYLCGLVHDFIVAPCILFGTTTPEVVSSVLVPTAHHMHAHCKRVTTTLIYKYINRAIVIANSII